MPNSAMGPKHCLDFIAGKLIGFEIDLILEPESVAWCSGLSFESCMIDPQC